MGGWGSGYFRPHKTTVKACLPLDIAQLTRQTVFRTGVRLAGTGCVPHPETGALWVAFTWTLQIPTPEEAALRLSYSCLVEGHDAPEQIAYDIALTTTPQHNGGMRWWWRCPLTANGEPCTRRVRKLYLPPGAKYFGCRLCFDLSYASRQTYQKTPRWLLALMQRSNGPRLGLRDMR